MSKGAVNLTKVFVYGTLKKGEPNHYWLTKPQNGHSKFVSEGATVEKFPLVVGTRYNIPFLLDRKGLGHNVRGEIYEVDEAMFANLDILEDYPKYYDRQVENIHADDKSIVSCWLYMIRSFPESLLLKKMLQSYCNTEEQSYCERSQRESNIKASDDMAF